MFHLTLLVLATFLSVVERNCHISECLKKKKKKIKNGGLLEIRENIVFIHYCRDSK